jgi:hypothetical protein
MGLMHRKQLKEQQEAALKDERKAWKALNEAQTDQERAALQVVWEEAANRIAKIATDLEKLNDKSKLLKLFKR